MGGESESDKIMMREIQTREEGFRDKENDMQEEMRYQEAKNTAKRNTQGRATLLKQRTLMTTLRKWNMSGPM